MVKRKEQKTSNLISVNEVQEREQTFMQCMKNINICDSFIKAAQKELSIQRSTDVELTDWQRYLRCDGFPRPDSPPELRSFIEKIRKKQNEQVSKTKDWNLFVNERSLLTQNVLKRKDLTFRTLRKSKCPDIGSLFEKDIAKFLYVLQQIDYLFDDDLEMERLSLSTQLEIVTTRDILIHELEAIFNRFTYRIIRMDNLYMTSTDGKVAKYSYECDNFRFELWSLRNVPIRFTQMELPYLVAEMSCVDVSVQMPLSVLVDCLTLQCIHMNFDKYTQSAKSYEQVVIQPTDDLNAGIVDLQECLTNEWRMQIELQMEELQRMREKRERYEAMLQEIALQEGTKKKRSMKRTVAKAPKEVLKVPEGMYPDIYSQFLNNEDKQYKQFLNDVYHPKLYMLTSDEINLRKYFILGGIYSIQFVQRPGHVAFDTYNVTLHEDGRVLYVRNNVVVDCKPDKGSSSRNSKDSPAYGSRRTTDSHLIVEPQTSSKRLTVDEVLFFIVSIKLPAHLFQLGDPIACQYVVEQVEPQIKKPEFSDEKKLSKRKKTEIGTPTKIVKALAENFKVSKNAFRPSRLSILRNSTLTSQAIKTLNTTNFQINNKLTHAELRNLKRYCMPRVISSFKFPMEFKDEFEAAEARKVQKTMLIRRPRAEEIINPDEEDFEYDYLLQQSPERVYPVFDQVDPINYPPKADKTTMYGFLETLDNIKTDYITNHKKVFDQVDFIPNRRSSKKEQEETPTDRNSSPVLEESKSMSVLNKRYTVETVAPKKEMVEVMHWTTKYIFNTEFNRKEQTVTLRTDRLGIFGFAFKRYEHFPFRDWSMKPNIENPEEIIFTLDTFHMRVILYITTEGIRGYVTDLSKEYTVNPVIYLEIEEPISNFNDFRRRFIEKNINIFAEHDACYYIENGYNSVKHLATEQHTYNAMALNCKSMSFFRSDWNRLATRRNIILCMKNCSEQNTEVTVRITPEKTSFVEVTELCSDNLDVFKLDYKLTWRNVGMYFDLHQAILSMNSSAALLQNKNVFLIHNLKQLLSNINILSFS